MRERLLVLLGILVFFLAAAAILFGFAGRFDLPMFWAYLGSMAALPLLFVWIMEPELMKERRKPGPGGKDCGLRRNVVLVMLAVFVVAGLDAGRYHWSDAVPRWAQISALVLVIACMCLAGWASRVNRFHSAVVRIQSDRGHHVITTGPYQYVRHPTYAAAMLWLPLTGTALGSWWAVVPASLAIPLFLRRLLIEERLLFAELEGYREYSSRVPWRIIPGLW